MALSCKGGLLNFDAGLSRLRLASQGLKAECHNPTPPRRAKPYISWRLQRAGLSRLVKDWPAASRSAATRERRP